jgi:hypothetical protein
VWAARKSQITLVASNVRLVRPKSRAASAKRLLGQVCPPPSIL